MTEPTSTYPFSRGQFVCKGETCQSLFFAQRKDIEYEPGYQDGVAFAKCPDCGSDAIETVWMKNLHRTIGTAKGANMSVEGRAKSRLNGFTTGSSSALPWYQGKIPMAPAKPSKYPECDDCQDRTECHEQVIKNYGTKLPVYCHRKMEITLKYAAAFLSGDPERLKLIAANNAAQMQMVFNSSLKKIFERGVEVIEKDYHWDKDGDLCNGPDGKPYEAVKISAHPLIKRCIEIAQVMGFTLGDWTMTPKSKEAKEQVAGFLAGVAAGSGTTVEALKEKFAGDVEKFKGALESAHALRQKDKALNDFEAEQGKREGDV